MPVPKEKSAITKPEPSAPAAVRAAPKIRGGTAEVEALPPSSATLPAFVFLHPRGEYRATVDGVLPHLIRQPLISGICGVVEYRDGSFDIDGLISDSRQAHKILLPLDLGYSVETSPGSRAYCTPWETIRNGQPVASRAAEKAFANWCQARMADGTLPRPSVDDLERLERKHAQFVEMPSEKGGHSLQMAELQKLLDVVRAALVEARREAGEGEA